MNFLRCAIYTRKSSEDGLDQSFNSLDAQRGACEAYILSQAGEGWQLRDDRYDDGGWSGGTMDRPGLRRLLGDVAAGLVNIVVVYKVDRLTRSLADFAKIVDVFDRYNASFVSVTQAFNTTTSMGRLTLNVLLSFAQFEREVTGERIRDKIAASKKLGLWMGGNLPLGYDAPASATSRTLVLNPGEAESVRHIFNAYLKLGSVAALQEYLERAGFRSKVWTSSRGRQIGGLVFSRGALLHLLKNRTYLGEIPHRDVSYPAKHPPIIGRALFEEVQAKLALASRRRKTLPSRAGGAPLKGLLFDCDGHPMSPTFAKGRRGRTYRYYVSAPLQQGRKCGGTSDALRRVPAEKLESFMAERLQQLLALGAEPGEPLSWARGIVRMEVHPTSLQVVVRRAAAFAQTSDALQQLVSLRARLAPDEQLEFEPGEDKNIRYTIALRFAPRGGRTWASGLDEKSRARDEALVRALRRAHELLSAQGGSPLGCPELARPDQAPSNPYDRRLLRLAFLAPDLQRGILSGAHPRQLNLERLMQIRIPTSWAAQRALFGSA